MQQHFEDIATKFFSWAVLTLEKKIPLLFSTPDISATPAKISITSNLNISSSRIFNPENCYMLIIKLDLRLRSNLVFHYISLDKDVNGTPETSRECPSYVCLIYVLFPEGLSQSHWVCVFSLYVTLP